MSSETRLVRVARGGPEGKMSEPKWLTEEQQRSWRAFLSGAAWLQEALNRDLEARAGLSLNEYEILVRLSEAPEGRVRMSVLAEQLVHSRSRLTHTVARMQRRGWVDRVPCADDGRGVEAVLTDAGRDVLIEIAPAHVASVREHLVDVLTAEQMSALGEIFALVGERLCPQAPEVLAVTGGRSTTST